LCRNCAAPEPLGRGGIEIGGVDDVVAVEGSDARITPVLP